MDFSKIKKIYMIGVKGVGMTMLAQFLSAKGIKVSGSDTKEKFITDEVLKKAGVKVREGFDRQNIPKDADLIIYSTAYSKENNPELAAVLAGKRKVLTYAQTMGQVFNQNYGIAIIGSHGKTTTAAWLGFVMHKAGLEPSVMVGSNVPQLNGASIVGDSFYLAAEVDEYQNKLKYFYPKAVLLNNIDYDHPDFFQTRESYERVFIDFIKKIPKKGFLVANFDDAIIRKIALVNCLGRVIGYGINNPADYIAHSIKQKGNKQYFKIKIMEIERGHASKENDLGEFSIQLSGRHNIYNALAVIAACIELEIGLFDIRKYLEEFTGTVRRMQILGDFRGAAIIDDYAHHPTEIKATLAGARKMHPDKNIIAIFQPHTFSRTKALLNDFATSFKKADKVIILDIYGSAREKHGGVKADNLANMIKQQTSNNKKQEVLHLPTLKEAEKYLRKNIEKEDIVLLMGAGDVFRIGENLIQN